MSGLKEIKRRIVSVKNTQKITRAMKLVSSAKYARANQFVVNARPYAKALESLVANLQVDLEEEKIPLLARSRTEKKIILVVLASDRGLCGGLNSNLLKASQKFLQEKKENGVLSELVLWGRRAESIGRTRLEKVLFKKDKVLEKPNFSIAAEFARGFIETFSLKSTDAVYVAFSEFKNAMTQIPKIEKILPIELNSTKPGTNGNQGYLYEPIPEIFLQHALERCVEERIYRILLEGMASEHAARMTAMDSATNNADTVIRSLTLAYNRERQASITKELIEITSGAEAL